MTPEVKNVRTRYTNKQNKYKSRINKNTVMYVKSNKQLIIKHISHNQVYVQ